MLCSFMLLLSRKSIKDHSGYLEPIFFDFLGFLLIDICIQFLTLIMLHPSQETKSHEEE